MKSRKPVRKVKAQAGSASLATAVVVLLAYFGVDVPAEVAAAGVTLVGFAAGYFTNTVKPA